MILNHIYIKVGKVNMCHNSLYQHFSLLWVILQLYLIGREEKFEEMDRRVVQCISVFVLVLLFCSGVSESRRELARNEKEGVTTETERDVTTPITTVPMINPLNPTTITPITNPTPLANPIPTPTAPTITSPNVPFPASSSGGSWCVAVQGAPQTTLQVALDYACGYGGADCSAIQQGGSCYNPNTPRDHASYAFNNYYQKNPSPTSCNFGGSAIITNVDPSSGGCQYSSTSTSSSVLNTTNPTGAPVYGSQPSGSSNSASSNPHCLTVILISTCLVMVLFHAVNH